MEWMVTNKRSTRLENGLEVRLRVLKKKSGGAKTGGGGDTMLNR